MITVRWQTEDVRALATGGDEVASEYTSVVCDILTDQNRDAGGDYPEHPVEEGAAVTEHVIPSPRNVALVIRLSDAATTTATVSTLSSRKVDAGSAGSVAVLGVDRVEERSAEALAALSTASERGYVVDVVGLPLGDLRGYQIRHVTAGQDASTGPRAMTATLSLAARRTVRLASVDVPAPRVERARPVVEEGDQGPQQPAPAETPRQRASTLFRLGRGVGAV